MSCRTVLIVLLILIFLFVCGGGGLIQGWLGQAANAFTQKAGDAALTAAREKVQSAVDGVVRQTPIPITAKYLLGKIQGGANEEGWSGSVVTQTATVNKTYGFDYRSQTIVSSDAPAASVLNPLAQIGANLLNGNVIRLHGIDLVQAGVNVKQMALTDVRVSSGNNSVTICLPDAVVVSSHFDNTPGSTQTEIQGILQHGDQDVGTLARQKAEEESVSEAVKNGQILRNADLEAQSGIKAILSQISGIGEIRFAPKPCR